MRFIVCGGRDFSDWEWLAATLDRLHAKVGITEIAEGGSKGADKMARRWGEEHGIPVRTFPADWDKYGHHPGSRAGPIRNAEMCKAFKPDGVVAFPGDRGTRSMIAIAEAAGVPVWMPRKPVS